MRSLFSILFVSALSLCLISPAAMADALPTVIKWSLNHTPVNYFGKVSKEFKKNVEKRSQGRIRVMIKEENVGEPELLASVAKNEIQMSQVFTHRLETLNPEFGVFQLPFLFESDEHLTQFSESKEGRQLFASLEPKGVHAIDFSYSGGQIGIYGPKINSMADLKGKKFSVEDGSEHYIEALKAAGIEAQVIDTPLATYDGLIGKQVDAGESIQWMMGKFMANTKAKNVQFNFTRHRIVSRVILLSENFLKSLPQDLRSIVLDEAATLATNERKIAIDDAKNISAKFAKATKHLNVWTAEQRTQGRLVFEPFYKEFAAKNSSHLIDAINGLNPEKKPIATR